MKKPFFSKIIFFRGNILYIMFGRAEGMMKWWTISGAWDEKSFKNDWLSLSSHVGLIMSYAIT